MNAKMLEKLAKMSARLSAVDADLSQPEILADAQKYKALGIERAELQAVDLHYQKYLRAQKNLRESEEIMQETNDAELKIMAQKEWKKHKNEIEKLELALAKSMMSKDPDDARDVILEIRAGTGGNEAGLFAGDLFKMYCRYAENQNWRTTLINSNAGEHGGFKEAIVEICGKNVYRRLKFESGVHRVQRVPETESQGRVHTSACTVAVLAKIADIKAVDIDIKDLRIDTFKASGAGGQHVNKTDSAVRITHIPSGTVVECQDGRSQHKNKERALAVLASTILDKKRQAQRQNRAQHRKALIGSGDRSQRIRTYNFPQGRVSDHRINLTIYHLAEIMAGNLDEIIEPLLNQDQAERLADFE